MKKTWILLLILCGFAMAQRPYNNQRSGYAQNILWRDLHPSTQDSIRAAIADSLAALSADGVTVLNDGTFKQKVFNDTTALKLAAADSAGMEAVLKQLSSSNTNGGGRFIWAASGYTADGGTVFAGSSGYWVRAEYLQDRLVNALWYGTDGAAIQSALNKARNSGYDDATVFIPDLPNGARWNVTETINEFNSGSTNERRLLITGGSNTVLKIATNDTILKIDDPGGNVRIKNLIFHGNGRTSTGGVGIYVGPTPLGDLYFENIKFDTLFTGFDSYDLTAVTVNQMYARQCVNALRLGYNSDGHAYNQFNVQRCDTAIVIYGSSASGVQFNQAVVGYSKVGLVFRGGGSVTFNQGYWEGVSNYGRIGMTGNPFAGFRSVTFIGTDFQAQSGGGLVHESGFYSDEPDRFRFINCSGITQADSAFLLLKDYGEGSLYTSGNNFSGTGKGPYIQYANTKSLLSINDELTIGKSKQKRIFDANALTTAQQDSGSAIQWRFNQLTNKWLFSIRATSANNNATAWHFSVRDTSGLAHIGINKGFWELGNANVGNPLSPNVHTRSTLYFQQASIDRLWLTLRYAGSYRNYDLVKRRFQTDPVTEGKANFSANDTLKTIPLVGVHPDTFAVSIVPIYAQPSKVGDLSAIIVSDTLKVYRSNTTPAGLGFYWFIRRFMF